MSTNAELIRRPKELIRRPTDRNIFLAASIVFPLLVLIGYFRTYYFSAFFDVRPIANALVHAHALIMTLWVVYFVAQVSLIRSRNVKLHMTMGMVGIALAVIVIVAGMATAYDFNLVRRVAPPGMDPHSFFILPFGDMLMFLVFFAGAIYYRKRPAEHKTLMLMTAINFLTAALLRMPFFPEDSALFWSFALVNILAISCLIWRTAKHRKLNKVFAFAVLVFVTWNVSRPMIGETDMWLKFVAAIAP